MYNKLLDNETTEISPHCQHTWIIIKSLLLLITYAFLLVSITACSDRQSDLSANTGEAIMPRSSSSFKGMNFEEAVSELEQAGFTNISTEVLYDIYFGWTEEGEVESVKAGDLEEFKKGDVVVSDTPVVVTYHMSYKADPKDRTYNGIVYDHAFYCSQSDGLRSRVYRYYFFSESENKVLYITHTTAGAGKTNKHYGTYDGSFDSVITISFDSSESTTSFNKNQSGDNVHWKSGSETYIEKEVQSSLLDIKYW